MSMEEGGQNHSDRWMNSDGINHENTFLFEEAWGHTHSKYIFIFRTKHHCRDLFDKLMWTKQTLS